jgi:hypothetical protein
MKRIATFVIAVAMMIGGIGVASAQMHGSHGGSSGGAWHGGGSSWHNSGSWHGGHFHGGHSRVFIGVGFGAPFWGWGWWPGYYYPYAYPAYYPAYPYYDYPYYDYSGSYVEQGSSAPAPSNYSYYCPDPAGYYPEVATCPKGWLRVVPQGAPGPTGPATY